MNFLFIVLHILILTHLTLTEVSQDCQPGYHLRHSDSKCHPDCENCSKENCNESGVCLRCNPKYVLIGETCIPLCRQKCIHGFCASPNTCQCNEGYLENPKTKVCEPICTKSCGDNAFCSTFNECTCNPGFYGDANTACQSWCKTDCKNGQCIGPDKCECYQGFVEMKGVCIHDCPACRFGDCSNEGVCICWPGLYFNKKTGSCEVNPYEDPTKSSHLSMFSTTIDQKLTTVFKDKIFTEDMQQYTMETNTATEIGTSTESETTTDIEVSITLTSEYDKNCTNGCWGGICLDGVCQCPEGLLLNVDTNECIMPCENTCRNGICSEGKICECFQGYIYQNTSGCVPKCDPECINSICVAPTSCECFQGDISKFNFSSALQCLPTCDGIAGNEHCQNGACVAVNKCQCLEGFIPKPGSRFECLENVEVKHHYRTLLYVFWIILLLAILIIVLLIYLVWRKLWKVSYDVRKREKYHSVMFRDTGDAQCVF